MRSDNRANQNLDQAQDPLVAGVEVVSQLEAAEWQQGVRRVQVLAPVPVDRFVFAQFDIGHEPKFGQAVECQQGDPCGPAWFDANWTGAYILNLVF